LYTLERFGRINASTEQLLDSSAFAAVMEGLGLMCGAGNFLWTKTDVSEEHITSTFRLEEISSTKTGKQ
jgi:hypothetical protein